MVAFAGSTVTEPIAGPVTVTGTVFVTVVSSTIFTVITALPFASAVTFPTRSTVATDAFDVDQRTTRDFGFRSVAVTFADWPSSSVSDAGATKTAGGNGSVESQAAALRLVVRARTACRQRFNRSSDPFTCPQKYSEDRPNASAK